MAVNHNEETCRCCMQPVSSVSQTLDEMDFERGIWPAALNGDVERVTKFLSGGGDPDSYDSSSFTALHYASRNGHTNVCELLLKNGAKVNTVTRTGHVSALHRAAYCAHCGVIRLLLKYGALVSLRDADGKTALHKAAEGGSFEATKILLEADRSISQSRDNSGRTASDCLPTNCCSSLRSLLS